MALTCFLFPDKSDEHTILSLRLDMQGQVDQPLQPRSVADVRVLQEQARTIVVFPTSWCGLNQVELPLLPDRKAREAIPYALEDGVAQSLTQLHVAIDRAYHHNQHYLALVIDKQIMIDWMNTLEDWGVNYDVITVDWFALAQGEGCVSEHHVMVNSPAFQGTLTLDIWDHQPHIWADDLQWYTFAQSANVETLSEVVPITVSFYEWVAARLLKTKPMNLCQGVFQHATSQTQVKSWYYRAGWVAGLWLLAFIGIHIGLDRMISKQSQALDQQIARVYHVFFPQSQQVVNPKVRIKQLLKQGQTGSNIQLWSLFENLSAVLSQNMQASKQQKALVQSLQFQNKSLTVTLVCDDFAALEDIEAALRKKQVHVQQLSAATEAEQVVAKLELSQ
ncbi:MAG: type II secretion system protein GspL [Gammaproteobacteria bacterium]|nr:type II secretion system protein GspL [Gammaproteobacteria bacterium]